MPSPHLRLRYTDPPRDKCEALTHQQQLEEQVNILLCGVRSGQYNQDSLVKALVGLQHRIAALTYSLGGEEATLHTNERMLAGSAAAQKAFQIQELLELILGNLEITDIVCVSQVSRAVRQAVVGSKKLQMMLCLRAAAPKSHLWTPFCSIMSKYQTSANRMLNHGLALVYSELRGFSCIFETFPPPRSRKPHRDMVTMRAEFVPLPLLRLPYLGDTYRRMFVCQPPIQKMDVFMSCCGPTRDKDSNGKRRDVCSERGITIGDLYDRARQLMDEHRWCPMAPVDQLADDGTVKLHIQFAAKVELPSSHPLVFQRRALKEMDSVQDRRHEAQQAKLKLYALSKRQVECDVLRRRIHEATDC